MAEIGKLEDAAEILRGDRTFSCSAIALDTIINQKDKILLAKVIFNEINRTTMTKTLCFGD